jgi:hypothetical protein
MSKFQLCDDFSHKFTCCQSVWPGPTFRRRTGFVLSAWASVGRRDAPDGRSEHAVTGPGAVLVLAVSVRVPARGVGHWHPGGRGPLRRGRCDQWLARDSDRDSAWHDSVTVAAQQLLSCSGSAPPVPPGRR